jgi:hypothetical protein
MEYSGLNAFQLFNSTFITFDIFSTRIELRVPLFYGDKSALDVMGM